MSETEVQETPERDFEAAARKEGWVSKEEWEAKGKDPALHKDAKSFVEAGEKILPILKSKVDRLEKELARTKETQTKERKATLEAMRAQSEAYEAKLKAALKDAVTKGDGDAVVELQDKLADSKEKRKEIDQQLKQPEETMPPEFQEFVEANEWYLTDKRLKRTADLIGIEIREENPTMPADRFFREVEKRVKEEFPEKFGKKPASPDSPGRGSGDTSKRGLKKEQKDHIERMAQYVPPADRAEFVKRLTQQMTQE